MKKRAREIAHHIISLSKSASPGTPFYIVAHADADGIASAVIITHVLNKFDIQPEIHFCNSTEILDQITYTAIMHGKNEKNGVWFFLDMGISSVDRLFRINKKIVIDHHAPKSSGLSSTQKIDKNKFEQKGGDEGTVIFSPHAFGIEDENAFSAALLTYHVAKNIVGEDKIAPLALLGTLGDNLNNGEFVLRDAVRDVLDICMREHHVEIRKDLLFPGKETLPLGQLIFEMNERMHLGFDNNSILDEMCSVTKIPRSHLKKKWIDLTNKEKRGILSFIAKKLLKMGKAPDSVLDMVGDVYISPRHEPGTHMHDYTEFAQLLNACNSMNSALIGYELCRTQKKKHYEEILEHHLR